ncbi:MAG: bifunctional YncE family protein/alkaline phosphatase family protein, partial [Armatimonadota bacterium]
MKPSIAPFIAVSAIAGVSIAAIPTQLKVGDIVGGGVVVPTGDVIKPAGKSVLIDRRPISTLLSTDGSTLFVRDNEGLTVVGVADALVKARVKLGGSGLGGMVVNEQETRLYTSNASNGIDELDITQSPPVVVRKLTIPAGKAGVPYPAGLALDDRFIYVAANRSNAIHAIDLESGNVAWTVETAPAPVGIRLIGSRMWVSCWGRTPDWNTRSADSSRTNVAVDVRGVSLGGMVESFAVPSGDNAAPRKLTSMPVPAQPVDMIALADAGAIAVACADGDQILQISTEGKWKVLWNAGRHEAPTSMTELPDDRVAVTLGGANKVVVLNKETWKPEVEYATGWYPIGISGNRNQLSIVSAKGLGSRGRDVAADTYGRIAASEPVRVDVNPDERKRRNVYQFTGLVQLVDRKTDKGKTFTPAKIADAAVIGYPAFKHVIYVIKENRTYDHVFGDVKGANGDPELCLYGGKITPNHHKLANDFVLLDNYYCNGVLSADGHSWTTEGNATSFFERSFGGWTRSYPYGDEPLAISQTGHIWDAVMATGKSFLNFGEYDTAGMPRSETYASLLRKAQNGLPLPESSQLIGNERVRQHTVRAYPGWNMNIPDLLRVRVFKETFSGLVKEKRVPNFMTVYFPQDHTSGSSAGAPTPAAHVADNDAALGQLVETVSKSPVWKDTVIFVVEDDPQDG